MIGLWGGRCHRSRLCVIRPPPLNTAPVAGSGELTPSVPRGRFTPRMRHVRVLPGSVPAPRTGEVAARGIVFAPPASKSSDRRCGVFRHNAVRRMSTVPGSTAKRRAAPPVGGAHNRRDLTHACTVGLGSGARAVTLASRFTLTMVPMLNRFSSGGGRRAMMNKRQESHYERQRRTIALCCRRARVRWL
jgi:hypothetical protein